MKKLTIMALVVGVLCACGQSPHEKSVVKSVVLTSPVRIESNYPRGTHNQPRIQDSRTD